MKAKVTVAITRIVDLDDPHYTGMTYEERLKEEIYWAKEMGYDWMQQYKKKAECYNELARIIAGQNCDYNYWKSRYYVVNAERAKEKQRADEAEKRLSVIKNSLNSWREIYTVDGLEEERRLTEDVLKIIEMLEVMEVENSDQSRGEGNEIREG